MNNHLSDIEIFEFSHHLIDDENQVMEFANHIASCETCQLKIEKEKALSKTIQSNLTVTERIDVSEKVLAHFQTEKKPIFIDLTWSVYYSGFISLLYVLYIYIPKYTAYSFPTLNYLNATISAIFLVLMIDLLVKFLKFKKSITE